MPCLWVCLLFVVFQGAGRYAGKSLVFGMACGTYLQCSLGGLFDLCARCTIACVFYVQQGTLFGSAACGHHWEWQPDAKSWENTTVAQSTLAPTPDTFVSCNRFCDEGSLRDALDCGLLTRPGSFLAPSAVLALAHDVASAMLHLHSEGIVHGDLKAGNVMLTSTGGSTGSSGLPSVRMWATGSDRPLTAKVADFGLVGGKEGEKGEGERRRKGEGERGERRRKRKRRDGRGGGSGSNAYAGICYLHKVPHRPPDSIDICVCWRICTDGTVFALPARLLCCCRQCLWDRGTHTRLSWPG